MKQTKITHGWKARLDLAFTYCDHKTLLTGKKHSGPLMVQKPFYPEINGCCHVYLIHPPGGIVAGDDINLYAQLNKNAHALITTPGATKYYRSIGPVASQSQYIQMEDNAILEWLPQETVCFNQANAVSATRIYLKNNNRFFAWEIQCLGLPAQKEYFTQGKYIQKFEIWKNNKPLLLETNRIVGNDLLLEADWGLQGYKSMGTLIVSDYHEIIDRNIVSNILAKYKDHISSFTTVNGLFIIRSMSMYAEKIKQMFTDIWKTLRPVILEVESSSPRIWNT